MNYADKSINVNGNLNQGPVRYTCYPVNEFSQGKWLISINSVTFDSTQNYSNTCAITCNFVTSKKRSTNGDIQIYEEPLNIFHLKSSQTASRGIFRFCNYYY